MDNKCFIFSHKTETQIDLQENLFSIDKEWTMMMWLNIFDFTTCDDISILTQAISGGSYRYTIAVRDDHCLYSWNSSYGNYTKIVSDLKENKPFHLTIVNNKGKYKFYIDGELKLEKFYQMSDTNTVLGCYLDYQYVSGAIDEFKVYNKILTDKEIKSFMYKKDTNMKDLMMYFNFNEIKNIDGEKYIIDISKNYKDLKIINFDRLEDTFVNPNKFVIKKDNKYYNINLDQFDIINDELVFYSLYDLIVPNDKELIPINELKKFNILIYK